MSGPSEAALRAAVDVAVSNVPEADIRKAVRRAHDPALGLDRSVCLRDVVAELWHHGQLGAQYAQILEREFGGGA